jgi:hypothetical protein
VIVIWTAFSWGLPFRWQGLVHAIEMAFESVDVNGPEATELFEPGVELLKWSRFQPVEAALRVDCRFDEAGVAKDAEMLGDGRLGHVELALDLADGLLIESQEAEDRAAVGLGDDLECVFHELYMPLNVYTCQGIFKTIFFGGCG